MKPNFCPIVHCRISKNASKLSIIRETVAVNTNNATK